LASILRGATLKAGARDGGGGCSAEQRVAERWSLACPPGVAERPALGHSLLCAATPDGQVGPHLDAGAALWQWRGRGLVTCHLHGCIFPGQSTETDVHCLYRRERRTLCIVTWNSVEQVSSSSLAIFTRVTDWGGECWGHGQRQYSESTSSSGVSSVYNIV